MFDQLRTSGAGNRRSNAEASEHEERARRCLESGEGDEIRRTRGVNKNRGGRVWGGDGGSYFGGYVATWPNLDGGIQRRRIGATS
jgi:hypothetical protein